MVETKIKACSGFGHRRVFENITEQLDKAISYAADQGCKIFYTGAMGEFDSLFSSAVRKAKKLYPDIKLICVKPYMTKDINARCESISNLYIEIEDLNVKILRERGLKKCAVCGTENNLSNAFCFKCGARFDDADAIPADVIAPPNASATPSRKDNKVLPAEAAPVPAETGDIIEAAKAEDTTAEDNKEE